MPNRFLTRKQVDERIVRPMAKAMTQEDQNDMSLEERRGYIYDLQTRLCGFPANEEERKRYIETGSV